MFYSTIPVRMNAILFLFSALSFFGIARADTPNLSQELSLKLHYQVDCSSDTDAFPGIIGEIKLKDRKLRFNLFKYVTDTEINVNVSDQLDVTNLPITYYPSSNCTLTSLTPELTPLQGSDSLQSLALKYSPLLVIRQDQYEAIDRDTPMGLTYSIVPLNPEEGSFTLVYTLFFSNETVHGLLSTSKAASLGEYGRRTDIEWLYAIDLDKNGNPIGRHPEGRYQSGFIGTFGHSTHHFKGEFVANSAHPILYDFAAHNVFKDRPKAKVQRLNPIAFHLVPRENIQAPAARENWMWQHPWTFKVNDLELSRDKMLSHPSNEYLYVLLHGKMTLGEINVDAKVDGKIIPAGEGKDQLKALGQNLWHEESYSAIHLGANIDDLHGEVLMMPNKATTELDAPRFFKLVPNDQSGFVGEEITSRFKCETTKDCTF